MRTVCKSVFKTIQNYTNYSSYNKDSGRYPTKPTPNGHQKEMTLLNDVKWKGLSCTTDLLKNPPITAPQKTNKQQLPVLEIPGIVLSAFTLFSHLILHLTHRETET